MAGALLSHTWNPTGFEDFKRLNYGMQGNVHYQYFLQGVMAGIAVLAGPPIPTKIEIPIEAREQQTELPPGSSPAGSLDDLATYVDAHPHKFGPDGEFVNDSPKELQTVEASEVGTVEDVLLAPVFSEEIIVPGITVHDGVIVGTGERTPEDITTSEIPAATAADVPTATEAPATP